MMTDTQQDVGKALQDAVLQAALDTDDASSTVCKEETKNKKPWQPGVSANPAGRPKGALNKTTKTIREAVEKAAQECHPEGLAGWLIERAQGGVQDRQIFAQMVNKALPLQVQANVDGGIKLELSWLSARNIGTVSAQLPETKTQVIDLQQDSEGQYRIKDPSSPESGPEK